jgi:tRNA threonylcarbamoyladenosine biosynthesis protein TsaB
LILIIETSANFPSAAICNSEGKIVANCEHTGENKHAEVLPEMVNDIIVSVGGVNTLSAVAISRGPGSYTGLRIGTSLAKGLCYALNIPLIAYNALTAMAEEASLSVTADLVFGFLDARRNEVYCSIYYPKTETSEAVEAIVLDNASWVDTSGSRLFVGNCTDKVRDLIQIRDTDVWANMQPTAAMASKQVAIAFLEKRFENLAYFEPHYLKDFIPGISTKFKL